ncbi:MAG: DUF2849 domain-containing protein [Silicimonas sp.]|nr:DUF2849 domain-containing protein [Silicimonas sp.]
MSRHGFTPKRLIARRVTDDRPVWLTADDRWSGDMAKAEIFEDEAVADDRLLFAITQPDAVTAPALVEA